MKVANHWKYVIAAAFWAAVSIPAHGQVVCADRPKVAEHLMRNFQESSAGTGLTYTGQAIELFVARSGTWTIVVSTPAGQACIVSHGEAWQAAPTPHRGTGRSS